jgi:hypothetical protein
MPWLTVGLVALAIGIGAAALMLWWQLPRQQMENLGLENPKERADVEDNFRKTFGQLLGGVAVLVGAIFAYFQFLSSSKHLATCSLAIKLQKVSNNWATTRPSCGSVASTHWRE